MSNTLSLFVNDDYLQAAFTNSGGGIEFIQKNGDSRLYFYFRKDGDKDFSFSSSYLKYSHDNNPAYILEFMNDITGNNAQKSEMATLAFLCLLNVVKEEYFFKTKTKPSEKIPLQIVFSDNLDIKTKVTIKNLFFSNGFVIHRDDFSVSELLAVYVMNTGANDIKHLISLDSMGTNLNLVLSNREQYSFRKIDARKTAYSGNQKIARAFAETLISAFVERNELTISKNDFDAELNRQSAKVFINLKEFLTLVKNKETIKVQMHFVFDGLKKQIVEVQSKQILQRIENLTVSILQETQNLLSAHQISASKAVGVLIGNEDGAEKPIAELFNRSGFSVITPEKKNDTLLVEQMFSAADEATSFQLEKPIVPKVFEYKEVQMVELSKLKVGQQIKLNNFDPAPGKGGAIHEFEYMGNNTLKVLYSTRTLNAIIGGNVWAISTVWKPGMQVELNVEIAGKKGVFKTRPIVTMLLKEV